MRDLLKQLGGLGEPYMPNATVDLTKLTPLADMVLVRRIMEDEKSAGGLFLPQVGRDKRESLRIGEVIVVGRGDLIDGRRLPMQCKPGDRVVYARCPDNDVRINGEDLVLLREEQHVLAILET